MNCSFPRAGYFNGTAEMREVFRRAYRNNAWGDPESVSGPGSGLKRTTAFRDELPPLWKELDVRSLLDAGCGDFNWLKEITLPNDYTGIDIVEELIEHNQRYGSVARRFVQGDFTRDPLPRVDLILCRDCLAHFSFEDVWAGLRNFKKTGSRYLLSTTFVEHLQNFNIVTGEWWPINLERPPFNFPPPQCAIDEKCRHTGGIYSDKRLSLWPLTDIPLD